MRALQGLATLSVALALTACNMGSAGRAAPVQTSNAVISVATATTVNIAGMYSASYVTTINGSPLTTQDYLYIAPNGLVNVYLYQDDGSVSPGRNCYLLASGQQVDAPLQNAILVAGTSPSGVPDYEIKMANGDTFGIIAQADSNKTYPWFIKSAQGAIANFSAGTSLQSVNGYSYAFGGAVLSSPTLTELQAATCP